jgi:hypothetical protein
MFRGKGLLDPSLQFNLIDTDKATNGSKEDGMEKIEKQIKIISKMVKRYQQKIGSKNIGLSGVEKWAKAIQRIHKLWEDGQEC